MSAWVEAILAAIEQHAAWAGLLLFLVGFAETMMVIGYLIPGTALMVGAGVLVGQGALSAEIAASSLLAGAVAGDAVGYWLGRRYGPRLLKLRPFMRRKAVIDKAQALLRRHAGKAIIVARLVGPIRPLVPFLAGAANLNPYRFLIFNVLSGVISTVVHLVPGIIIGVGLRFSGAMTGRLAVLLLLLIATAWVVQFAGRWLWRNLAARGPEAAQRLRLWSASYLDDARWERRLAAIFLIRLVDPHYRATLVLGICALLLLGSVTGLVRLVSGIVQNDPVMVANTAVYAFFAGLRTPFGDSLMAVFAALGHYPVMLILMGTIMAFLLARRAWVVATYWLLTAAFAYGSAVLLGAITSTLDPALTAADPARLALPSAHTAVIVIVLGFASIVAADSRFRAEIKITVFASAMVLASLISVAQLYFGVSLISGLAGGLLLGAAWLSLLAAAAMGRLRAIASRPAYGFLGVVGIVLVIAAALYSTVWHRLELDGYRRTWNIHAVEQPAWSKSGWQALPAYRVDLIGEAEEPANVQIVGNEAAIAAALGRAGWRRPTDWDVVEIARVVTGSSPAPPAARPVLPSLWNGRAEAIVRVREQDSSRLVLRLWDLGYRLAPSQVPLYVGTVSEDIEGESYLYGIVSFPPRPGDYDQAVRALAGDLGLAPPRARADGWRPASHDERPILWSGETLVLDLGAMD